MDNLFIGFEKQRRDRVSRIENAALALLLFIGATWTAFEVGQAMANYECRVAVAPGGGQLWLTSE